MSCDCCVYPPPPIIVSNLPPSSVIAFNESTPNTIRVGANNLLFNGIGWDPWSPLLEATVLTSTALAATFLSGSLANYGSSGVLYHVNCTARTGTATVTAVVQCQNPALPGTWLNLFVAAAAIAAAGSYLYALWPGAAGAAVGGGITEYHPLMLPRTWRLVLGFGGAGTITCSAAYQLLR